jgi:hypothetical protein
MQQSAESTGQRLSPATPVSRLLHNHERLNGRPASACACRLACVLREGRVHVGEQAVMRMWVDVDRAIAVAKQWCEP